MSRLKRFDVHVKTIDGVTQQTVAGALVTLVSVVLVLLLTASELRLLAKKDVESYVLPDSTVGMDEIRISFDIQFPAIACERVRFVHEVLRGGLTHASVDEEVKKTPLRLADNTMSVGCRLHGSKITEKVAGTFHFRIDSAGIEGADGEDSRQEVISHQINKLMFISDDSIDSLDSGNRVLDASSGARLPDGHYPLNEHVFAMDSPVAIKHYALQVVPTVYKALNGSLYRVNQYSAIQRTVSPYKSQMGVALGGQPVRGLFGVFFTYDFYPVRSSSPVFNHTLVAHS